MAFFDFLHFFTDLFNSVEKSWHKLEPDVQNALVQGSGVINVINQNLQSTPQQVLDLINAKFPDITKEKLAAGLTKVTAGLQLAQNAASPAVLTTIQNLQTYFSGMQGKFWQGAASTTSQMLAIAFSPDETPFAKVAMFIEFVYRKKIKA